MTPRSATARAHRRVWRRRARALPPRLTAVLLAGALGLAACPPAAYADADPASDYLLVQPVFYPYAPPTSPALQHALQQALQHLKAAGVNLKVAIIAVPEDLGAVANLFGQPQRYADFLDREISFNTRQPLLVVMPAGYGTSNAGPPSAGAGTAVDARHGADGLARSAVEGVVRLARVMGHPIAVPAVAAVGGGSSGSLPGWIPFAAPVLVVLGLAAISATVQRRRQRRDA